MKFYGRLSPGIATSLDTPLELVLHLPRKADGVVVKIWERAEFVDIDGKVVKEDGGDDLLIELHGSVEKDPALRERGRGKFVVANVVHPPRDAKAKLHTIKVKIEGVEEPYEATIPSTEAEMVGQNFEIAITIEHGGGEVFKSKVPTFIRPALATPRVVAKRVVQYADKDGEDPIWDEADEDVFLGGYYVTLGKADGETDDGHLIVAGFAMIDDSGHLLPCDGEGKPLPGEVLSLRTHKDLFAYVTRDLPKVAKTIGDTSISLRLCYPIEADGRLDYNVPHTNHLFGANWLGEAMTDLDERVYRVMETTIDLLDYIHPPTATIYVASYGQIFTPETEVIRKTPGKYTWMNGAFVFQRGKEEKVKVPKKPGANISLKGLYKKKFMRYAFEAEAKPIDQATAEFVEGDKPHYITTIPRGSFKPGDTLKRYFLVTEERYADLIYDTAAEMNACGFSWHRAVADLSEEVRRNLFEKNLHEQKDMPQLPINGRSWIQQLAQYCTYDSDGNYFPKWLAGKPGVNRKFSTPYLEFTTANRQEIILKQGPLYAFVQSEDLAGVLYSIEHDANGIAKKLTPHRMQKDLIWQIPVLSQNAGRAFDVTFIATLEGAKQESKATRASVYHLKDGDQASHQIIDPRRLVAAALGSDVAGKIDVAEDDDWGWFTQMCAALFQEPYYSLDLNEARSVNPWVHKFGADNLAEQTRKFMEKAWKEQGSDDGKPITKNARERTRAMMKDTNVLIIPQGFPSSENTRFIGTDGHYAFDRDLVNGFVYVMPNHEYIGALAQGKFFADLYEDVAWLVPMMEFTAYLAAFAVGGWSMGARKFVTKKIGKELVREAIVAVRPALIAVLVDAMLDLVTKPVMHLLKKLDDSGLPWDEAEKYVELWQEFLRGFFDGYIVLQLEGRVAKLHDIVMPQEAKAVMIAARLYELVQKFRRFLDRVQGALTDDAISKLLHNLDKAASHFLRGMASVLAMLYYADIDAVKPLLEIFDADTEAPHPEEWAHEADAFFHSITEKLADASGKVASLSELLDIRSTKPYAMAGAVAVGYIAFIMKLPGLPGSFMNRDKDTDTDKVREEREAKRKKGSKRKKIAGAVLGGLVLGFVVYEGYGDEMLGVSVELLKEVGRMFPGKDKKAAKLHGELIGKLVGTMFVDKALLGEKSTLGKKLKDRPALKFLVNGAFGGGTVMTILKIVFHRYVDLAQRLSGKVSFVHHELKQFVEQEHAKKAALEQDKTPNLKVFRATSDDVISLREFMEGLTHLAQLMERDRDAFQASFTEGVTEIKEDFLALNELSKAGARVDLDKLKDRELRAAMIAMNGHAATAIHDILKGMDYLFAEIGGEQSIMTILQELGIDTGDLTKAQTAVHSYIEPKMEGFKKAEESWKKKQADADAKDKQEEEEKKKAAEESVKKAAETLKKIVGLPNRP